MVEILTSAWNVLAMMALWLIFGFLLAGVVGVLMPRAWAEKAMGRSKGWRGVLNAVLIGVPLPICSCGVLPLTQALRKSGASKGAAAGFLISTPQTGVDSVLATYALLGPVFAIARPVAAFLTGIFGGGVVNFLSADDSVGVPSAPERNGHCCCCGCHKHEAGRPMSKPPLVFRCLAKTNELFGEIVKPLFVGLVIAALVTVLVPENFFATAFGGNDWLAMPAMVLIGFPMYVCSTASIPIAASMIMKGLSPGAAFVFLMVGPAINAASLATVSALIGRRQAAVYALVIACGAVLCGVAINLLPFETLPRLSQCCGGDRLSAFDHVSAGLLVVWIAWSMLTRKACHRSQLLSSVV